MSGSCSIFPADQLRRGERANIRSPKRDRTSSIGVSLYGIGTQQTLDRANPLGLKDPNDADASLARIACLDLPHKCDMTGATLEGALWEPGRMLPEEDTDDTP